MSKTVKTLIMPLMTNFENSVVFTYSADKCMIRCVDALLSLNTLLEKFDEIYFVINENVDSHWNLQQKISADMSRLYCTNYKFIVLPKMTSSPAETVYNALSIIGCDNRTIFIKDGDNKFILDKSDMLFDNYVVTASLEKQTFVDPQHKSYVKTDEQGFITNCIEKRIISDKFIAGGYSFRDANLFKIGYDSLKKYCTSFYISDIIYWLILNKNEKFLPIEINNFLDFNIYKF